MPDFRLSTILAAEIGIFEWPFLLLGEWQTYSVRVCDRVDAELSSAFRRGASDRTAVKVEARFGYVSPNSMGHSALASCQRHHILPRRFHLCPQPSSTNLSSAQPQTMPDSQELSGLRLLSLGA